MLEQPAREMWIKKGDTGKNRSTGNPRYREEKNSVIRVKNCLRRGRRARGDEARAESTRGTDDGMCSLGERLKGFEGTGRASERKQELMK